MRTLKNCMACILMSVSFGIYCQDPSTDSLIIKLENELIYSQTIKVPIHQIVKVDWVKYGLDSTILVSKHQPDVRLVTDILSQLISEFDSKVVERLERMYYVQLDDFKHSWGKVYNKFRYSPKNIAVQRFSVIYALEQVLKAVDDYTKYGHEFMISRDVENFRLATACFYSGSYNCCNESKARIDYSDTYTDLHGCYWPSAAVPISYIDLVWSKHEMSFLSILDSCSMIDCPFRDNSIHFQYFANHAKRFNKLRSTKLSDFYQLHYSYFKTCHRHTMAFRYAGLHQFEDLTRFLVQRYIEDYDPKEYYGYMRDLVADDDFNLRIIVEEGIKHYKADPEMAQILMSKLPRGRTLDIMQAMDDRIDDVDQGLRVLSRSVDD